jgi:hypothetical protein
LTGCRIETRSPDTGAVVTESGAHTCPASATCTLDVNDTHFNETFLAEAGDGYQFIGWKKQHRGLCGGRLGPCTLSTESFEGNDVLMAVLASDETFYLEPQFLEEDYLRSYQPGDIVRLAGNIAIESAGLLPFSSPVTVTVAYSTATSEDTGEEILAVTRTIAIQASGETVVTRTAIRQEGNGARFDVLDEDGNAYLTQSSEEYGLESIPSPLSPSVLRMIDYYVMYAGHTTGPIKQGTRTITVSGMETVKVPAGSFPVSPVEHRDQYEYLVAYVDKTRGESVDTVRKMWVSPAKGVVKLRETRSEYSRTGGLEARTVLDLEATGMNF